MATKEFMRAGPKLLLCMDYDSRCIRVKEVFGGKEGFPEVYGEEEVVFISEEEWATSRFREMVVDEEVDCATTYFWIDLADPTLD